MISQFNDANAKKKERLLAALKIEFDNNANRVLNFMMSEKRDYEEQSEKRVIGNFVVNYYQKADGIQQFYIERK